MQSRRHSKSAGVFIRCRLFKGNFIAKRPRWFMKTSKITALFVILLIFMTFSYVLSKRSDRHVESGQKKSQPNGAAPPPHPPPMPPVPVHQAGNSQFQEIVSKYSMKFVKGESLTNFLHLPTHFPSVYTDDRKIMKKMPPLNVIPKMLHVMWKTKNVPSDAAKNLKRWHSIHEKWPIVLWTDDNLHSFVKMTLGDSIYYKLYTNFEVEIMRVDFARYLILYIFGGVYADLDVYPLRSLDPVLSHHSCILAREPEPYPVSIGHDTTVIGSNFFMACRQGHPFFPYLNDHMLHHKGSTIHKTGPMAVTFTAKDYLDKYPSVSRWDAVFMAPSLYFDPPKEGNGDLLHINLLKTKACPQLRKIGPSYYVKHICDVIDKKNTIDWRLMYQQPRYFDGSFTRHSMFDSYNKTFMKRITTVSVDTLDIEFVNPMTLMKRENIVSPWEYEQEILRTGKAKE